MCIRDRDNKVPIIVFDMMERENIRDAVLGKAVGTIVTGD